MDGADVLIETNPLRECFIINSLLYYGIFINIMEFKTFFGKVKSYLRELTIVTVGVLVALFVSNLKETSQAKSYKSASIQSIIREVESNKAELKDVWKSQAELLDSLNIYLDEEITLSDLFHKAGGLRVPTLGNTGLEFYSKNQIEYIDFEIMASLIKMNSLTELINSKFDKLMDFVLPIVYSDTKESKRLVIVYLRNGMESERQLLNIYEQFLTAKIDSTEE